MMKIWGFKDFELSWSHPDLQSTFKKSEDQFQDFEWYIVSSSCKNYDFLQALKSSYGPLIYFSDIFISGKNVVIFARNENTYRKADHNLSRL